PHLRGGGRRHGRAGDETSFWPCVPHRRWRALCKGGPGGVGDAVSNPPQRVLTADEEIWRRPRLVKLKAKAASTRGAFRLTKPSGDQTLERAVVVAEIDITLGWDRLLALALDLRSQRLQVAE